VETSKSFCLASMFDTAIDIEAMGDNDVREYIETREFKLVKSVPGKKLTVFHARRIPTSLYNSYVIEAPSENAQYMRAFQVGIVRVDNLVDTDGKTWTTIEPSYERSTPRGEIRIFSDKEMELFASVYLEEIGSIVNRFSRLPPGNEQTYRLPRSLLDDLAARMVLDLRHAAERKRKQQETSEQAKEPLPSPLSKDGENHIDATATELPIVKSDSPPTHTSELCSMSASE